jgi:hypothetical protein
LPEAGKDKLPELKQPDDILNRLLAASHDQTGFVEFKRAGVDFPRDEREPLNGRVRQSAESAEMKKRALPRAI